MEQIFLQGINVQDLKQLLLDAVEEKFNVLVHSDSVLGTSVHSKVLRNSVHCKNRTYLSRSEAAKLLTISLPTLNEWTKQGIIPAYRIGNRVLYKPEEIDNSLKEVCNLKYKRG